MIPGRQPGDNITLLNTIFWYAQDQNSKKHNQVLDIIYKDLDSNQKYFCELINPDYEYYIAKPENRVDYNRLFIPENETTKVVVPYKDLEKSIAENVGMKDFYKANIANGDRQENKKLHMHPDVFRSDMNIEDYYRFKFSELYKNDPFPVSKAFFDIEVDTKKMSGDFPEYGEVPVNAVSLVLQGTKEIYAFLLRTSGNPQIKEFEDFVNSGMIFEDLDRFIETSVGGPERCKKFDLYGFKYNFLFYDEDDEINLIADLFKAINARKPDFVLAWNMAFDIPYIIFRILKLGYDPTEIMCHPDFSNKIASYYIDERNQNEYAERGDYANISSYSVFLDQMIQYASRRKGQSRPKSFSLDYTGETVAGVKKLDYKNITTSISDLPYVSYKTFVYYNIMDTIVQYCIEKRTGDIDFVFNKSLMNNTRYCKIHRQTVYLANRGCREFYHNGFIIGNNVNKYKPKTDEKLAGAFVADPVRVNDYSRIYVNGKPSNLFDNDVDFDYSSLYPSIIKEFNNAHNTMIGLLIIDGQVVGRYCKENPRNIEGWTRASAFMEDIQSKNWLEFNSRWFALAPFNELYKEVEEICENIIATREGTREYDRNGLRIPLITSNGKYRSAIIFDSDKPTIKETANIMNFDKSSRLIKKFTEQPNQVY